MRNCQTEKLQNLNGTFIKSSRDIVFSPTCQSIVYRDFRCARYARGGRHVTTQFIISAAALRTSDCPHPLPYIPWQGAGSGAALSGEDSLPGTGDKLAAVINATENKCCGYQFDSLPQSATHAPWCHMTPCQLRWPPGGPRPAPRPAPPPIWSKRRAGMLGVGLVWENREAATI